MPGQARGGVSPVGGVGGGPPRRHVHDFIRPSRLRRARPKMCAAKSPTRIFSCVYVSNEKTTGFALTSSSAWPSSYSSSSNLCKKMCMKILSSPKAKQNRDNVLQSSPRILLSFVLFVDITLLTFLRRILRAFLMSSRSSSSMSPICKRNSSVNNKFSQPTGQSRPVYFMVWWTVDWRAENDAATQDIIGFCLYHLNTATNFFYFRHTRRSFVVIKKIFERSQWHSRTFVGVIRFWMVSIGAFLAFGSFPPSPITRLAIQQRLDLYLFCCVHGGLVSSPGCLLVLQHVVLLTRRHRRWRSLQFKWPWSWWQHSGWKTPEIHLLSKQNPTHQKSSLCLLETCFKFSRRVEIHIISSVHPTPFIWFVSLCNRFCELSPGLEVQVPAELHTDCTAPQVGHTLQITAFHKIILLQISREQCLFQFCSICPKKSSHFT